MDKNIAIGLIIAVAFYVASIYCFWKAKKINSSQRVMKVGEIIFWLFHPHLVVRKIVIGYRKSKAIKKALSLSSKTTANIYVVQIGRHFEVGTRAELHRYNKNGRKNLSKITDVSSLDFNCKYSIIYTAKNGAQQVG